MIKAQINNIVLCALYYNLLTFTRGEQKSVSRNAITTSILSFYLTEGGLGTDIDGHLWD